MGVFHVFKIVQMLPNRAKHHTVIESYILSIVNSWSFTESANVDFIFFMSDVKDWYFPSNIYWNFPDKPSFDCFWVILK